MKLLTPLLAMSNHLNKHNKFSLFEKNTTILKSTLKSTNNLK